MNTLRAWKRAVRGALAFCALASLCAGCVLLPTGRPPGSAQVIHNNDLVGTWQDKKGGSITFRNAGDFTDDHVCGQDRIRTGSWYIYLSTRRTETPPASQVMLTYQGGDKGLVDQYEAGGTTEEIVLWAALGDLDDTNYCRLTKK